jgi:hypothetical protein
MRKLTIIVLVAAMGLVSCGKKEPESPAPQKPTPAKAPEKAPVKQPGVEEQAKEGVDEAKKQVEETVEDVKKEAEKQVTQVSDAARQMMEGYLKQLGDLTTGLTGLDGGIGDVAKAPAVKDLIDQVKGSIEKLTGLEGGQLDALKEQFKPQIDAATKAFKAQVDRIGQIPSLSNIKGLLDGIPLIG